MIKVITAKSWIGVPFIQGGFTRKGCDCAGLIIGILAEHNITIRPITYLELGYYDHLSQEAVIRTTLEYCKEISVTNRMPGDIVIFPECRNVVHFAVISTINPDMVIHAHQRVGKVVETLSRGFRSLKNAMYFRFEDRSKHMPIT